MRHDLDRSRWVNWLQEWETNGLTGECSQKGETAEAKRESKDRVLRSGYLTNCRAVLFHRILDLRESRSLSRISNAFDNKEF